MRTVHHRNVLDARFFSSLLVDEIKKGRYVYYHGSGAKGKCPEPYVRQEVIESEFERVLRLIVMDEGVVDWVASALRQAKPTRSVSAMRRWPN